jgi:hypothetical protein
MPPAVFLGAPCIIAVAINPENAEVVMKFMLLICNDEAFRPPPRLEPEVVAWVDAARRREARISGSRFRPISEAKTIRIRNGDRSLAEGPIVQAKERITGYELIDCESMDEAIALASAHPMASVGAIEIRQLWHVD